MRIPRIIITTLLLLGSQWQPSKSVFAQEPLSQAIQLYRQGNYTQAQQLLTQAPDKPQDHAKWAYYNAITAAQLAQTEVATTWYQKVLQTYPGTPEARLAQKGLEALQANGGLDHPPGVAVGDSTVTANQNNNNTEMLQAMLPLMMSGGKGGGGMEWMLMSQLMQNGNVGTNGSNAPRIDPSVISNIINAQMMGQMNLGLDSKNTTGE